MSKLEFCPVCKNKCSTSATSCPKCGEVFEADWAKKIAERRKAVERKMWKKVGYVFLAIFLILGSLIGYGNYESNRLASLKTDDPNEYARLIEALESEVAAIPISDQEENIRLYKKLLQLDPDNDKYKAKLVFYEKARQEAEQQEKKAEQQAKEHASAEDHRKGFHCLSAWDGSHRAIKEYIENRLKDPDSFEHIETRITPVNPQGEHSLTMKYRAKNSLGGYVIEYVHAKVKNADCGATVMNSN
ncbi:MAG: hypothetical protein HQ515_26450 [Phycisphaeraceae bacterium]|nr:hypothetical protein [Phycisphaeraceae bacterium]